MRFLTFLAISSALFVNACFAQSDQERGDKTNGVVRVVDLTHDQEKNLVGWAINQQGAPLQHIEVSLVGQKRGGQNRIGKTTQTDKQGRFAFANVNTGVKLVKCGNQHIPVRIWNRDVAPPAAKQALLIVEKQQVVRGQYAAPCGDGCTGCNSCGGAGFGGHFGGFFQRILQNPWLIGAGTAAAIAIPLATDSDDQPSSSQSLESDSISTDTGSGEPNDVILDTSDAS